MTESNSNRKKNRRRGARKPLKLDTSVSSPCLSICRFDGEPFCRGCYRNADEIREWIIMTREQKLTILDLVAERRKDETGEQVW